MEKVIESMLENEKAAFEQIKILSDAIGSLTKCTLQLTAALQSAHARISALEAKQDGEGWKN